MITDYDNQEIFPYKSHQGRLDRYRVNGLLLKSKHYEAFNIVAPGEFTQRYKALRYLVANFLGLVSKVSADFLFGDPIQITAGGAQDFLEEFMFKNRLHVQNYESSISNSARGDSLFRLRVINGQITVEETKPSMYFPDLTTLNSNIWPEVEEIAWRQSFGSGKDQKHYLIREIHTPGEVWTRVHKLERVTEMSGEYRIKDEISVADYNQLSGDSLIAYVQTGVDRNLIVHVPNYKLLGSDDYFGDDDYIDLKSIQFAMNNRMTSIDNILDKHSDPILAVPPGILDENGKVKRSALHMIELGDEGEVPQYITWNANLESAFKQVDKLVDMAFMLSENSPEAFGFGEGKAESGRALKLRLLRTLAKKNRKQLYYTQGLHEVFRLAQLLSANNGFRVNDMTYRAKEEKVDIRFGDGAIIDEVEQAEMMRTRKDSNLISTRSAIMRMDNLTEDQAEEEVKRIKDESGDFNSEITPTDFANGNV